jgi:hypothetical protein
MYDIYPKDKDVLKKIIYMQLLKSLRKYGLQPQKVTINQDNTVIVLKKL